MQLLKKIFHNFCKLKLKYFENKSIYYIRYIFMTFTERSSYYPYDQNYQENFITFCLLYNTENKRNSMFFFATLQ